MVEKIASTTDTQAPQVDAVDQATLTPLVQRALKRENIDVIDWKFDQLHTGAGEWSAVYRFSGKGQDQEQTIDHLVKDQRIRSECAGMAGRTGKSGPGIWRLVGSVAPGRPSAPVGPFGGQRRR